MNIPRFFLGGLLTVLFSNFALAANDTIWPLPTPPPGVPSPAFAVPRLDWVDLAMANTARARKVADTIRVVFDGDSITAAWSTRGQKIWAERFAPLGAVTFGIGGDRTQFLLWRLTHGQVDQLHPKVVVLLIGTNNLGNHESVPDTFAGIKAIVTEYRQRCPDAVILLHAIFPRGQKPGDPLRAAIKAENKEIATLADGEKIIFVDLSDKFLQPDGSISEETMPDFLHPSEKSYAMWADALQPLLDKYLPGSAKPAAP